MCKYIAFYVVLCYNKTKRVKGKTKMSLKLGSMNYSRDLSVTVDQSRFYSHVHTSYELLFIFRGEGSFLIEDNEYLCRPNSLFLIPPGRYHMMQLSVPKDYERCVINFSSSLLPPILDKKLCLQQIADESVRELFERFDGYTKKYSGQALELLAQSFLTEVLVSVAYDKGEKIAEAEIPTIVKRAIEYINDNIEAPLSVKTIACALFVSETHLGHVFTKTMNTGLMHYVAIKKMYKARSMLRKGFGVTETCDRLGYKSYPTFLRNYKAQFGITPSQEQ